jgi:putative aldouronate transport system substrate-binding protein
MFEEERRMKSVLKVLGCSLLLLLVFGSFVNCKRREQSGSAAVSSGNNAADLYKQKYDEPVTVKIGRAHNMDNYSPGEDFENNAYTKWLRDAYNIDTRVAFLSPNNDDYNQRVTLAIASNDLPDIMIVSNRLQLVQLMSSGMVEDLTGLVDKYASPILRAQIESFGGLESAMSTTYFEGRQMSLSDIQCGGQDFLFWIREDWREKLGLPEPKTTQDFIDLARAFVDNDMAGNGRTIGFEVQNPSIAGMYNGLAVMDPYFNEAGAYPRLWVEDGSGKLIYGSVAPQVKDALNVLRDMYSHGLLAKDYATSDWQGSIASGYAGVCIGPWWIPDWPLNFTLNNNPNAVWKVYTWKSSKTGKFHAFQQPYNMAWGVVRKGYKNPELLVRFMNITSEVRSFYDGEALTDEEISAWGLEIPVPVREAYTGQQNINWGAWPLNLQMDFNDLIPRLAARQAEQLEAYKSGDTGMSESIKTILQNVIKWETGEDRSYFPWNNYMRYEAMQLQLEETGTMDLKKTYWPATTQTMELRWANLTDLEVQAYNRIIMGQEPLDYFDRFVEQWYNQGGTRITEEVNEQIGR